MINLTAYLTESETLVAPIVSNNVITANITSIGQPGETGGNSDKNYEAVLNGEEEITIVHDLNKYPAITIFDSAGDEVEGDYTHVNKNTVVLNFSAGFSGKAIFN